MRRRRPARSAAAVAVLLAATAGWGGSMLAAPTSGAAARKPPGVRPETGTGWATGKTEPALAEELAQRGVAGASFRVVYVLDDPPPPRGGARGAGEAERDRHLAEVRAVVAARRDPVVARLRASGHAVAHASDYAAVIAASGTGAAVAAAARDPAVRAVYLERTHRRRLDVSKLVTQAADVQDRGIDGAGVRVAVVDLGRIGAHPDLPAKRRLLCRGSASGRVDEHKTEVAGVIQSTDGSLTGVAPGVTLIDSVAADFSDAEVMAATDCAISRGASVVDVSFGFETDGAFDAFAEYVDRIVYNTGVSVVVAISNFCSNRVGSPEIAYNDISVGAFSDRNTVRAEDDKHACDDAVSPPFSAYRDPRSANRDREQPDLVAPGDRIRTTRPGGGFGVASGTSYAAPHVSGGAALVLDRGGFPNRQAERVRAVLMASARANVEGDPRLSDRDGAGAVQLAAADAVVRDGQSYWFATPGGRTGFPRTQPFTARAGQRVRVVLAWAHKPNLGNQTVSTDLDLEIRGPEGEVIASSVSYDNNFEIVEFAAPATGTYRARVTDFRPSGGEEHVGLAVSRTDR